MCYVVYYDLVNFQLKAPSMHGELKIQIVLEDNLNQKARLVGKMNQTIVYKIFQTLVIIKNSNLVFFS